MSSFHHPPPAFILPVPWILYSHLSYFPCPIRKDPAIPKLWFCTKLNNRNIKAPPPTFFPPQPQVQAPIRFELCRVDLWNLRKLLPCLSLFPSASPTSPFVLCLNVSHGMDSLAMGMLHDPFTFHVVFLLSLLPVLTFVMWLY